MGGKEGEMVIKVGKIGMRFSVQGRKCRLSGLLYADFLVFHSEWEDDLRVMIGYLFKYLKEKA